MDSPTHSISITPLSGERSSSPKAAMLGPFIYDTTSVVDRLYSGTTTGYPRLTKETLDEICRPLVLSRK